MTIRSRSCLHTYASATFTRAFVDDGPLAHIVVRAHTQKKAYWSISQRCMVPSADNRKKRTEARSSTLFFAVESSSFTP